jgi:intein/homing endonuclease
VGSFLSGGLDSVTGDARILYSIDGDLAYTSMEVMFEKVRKNSEISVRGTRTWITPRVTVRVLTTSSLHQCDARIIWGRVRRLYSHTTDKDVYRITLSGGRSIKVTGDHSVFKDSFSNKCLSASPTPVRELREGDSLQVPVTTWIGGESDSLSEAENMQLTLAGLYLEHGSILGDLVSLSIENEDAVIQFLRKLVEGILPGSRCMVSGSEFSPEESIVWSQKADPQDAPAGYFQQTILPLNGQGEHHNFSVKNGLAPPSVQLSENLDVNVWSPALTRWLNDKGFQPHSSPIRVPAWMFTASESSVSSFLRGYFSSKGTILKLKGEQVVINCSSISNELIKDLHVLLGRLGIFSSRFDSRPDSGTNFEDPLGLYTLTIDTLESVIRFREKVGFIQADRIELLANLAVDNASHYVTSCKIEKIEKEDYAFRQVYDLEVEGTERFIANEILCHNTSAIVCFASRHYPRKLKTFCMGFGNADDELESARAVADHFGTDHYGFTITDSATLEMYPRMIWHSEQPKLNTYSWFVDQFARKYVKVCLSGLGGDELFFGYPTSSRFESFMKAQNLMKVPGSSFLSAFVSGKRKNILDKLGNRAAVYLTTISPTFGSEKERIFGFKTSELKQKLEDEMNFSFFKTKEDFVQQAVFAEFATKLPDDFLSIDDSMSMAHSLENRVPLLDNQLLDLMLPVSYNYNYENGLGKSLLRRAMRGLLPEECFRKPKQGFSLDVVKWWKGEIGEEVRNTIVDSDVVKKYFDPKAVTGLFPSAESSYSTVSLLWTIYAFHVWHRLFIDQGKETFKTNFASQ